jgi:amino acid transporter
VPPVLTLINLRGIKETSGTNNPLVVIKITALALFIIAASGLEFLYSQISLKRQIDSLLFVLLIMMQKVIDTLY